MSTSSGQRAEVADGRDLRRDVVGGRRHDESEEGQAPGLVEAARDPEVEEGDAAVELHEQVAPVQVSVEHPVEQRPFEEGDQRGVQDGLGVDPRGADRIGVAPRKPFEAFHDQHAPRHQGRMGTGDDDGVLARVGQHAGDVEHVLGLEAEVELLHDRLCEQLDEGRRVGEGGDRDAAHQQRGEPAHGGQVAAHQPGHVGTLHLHHHGLAAVQARRVDLGHRCRRHGRPGELAELLFEGHAQVGLHDAPDHGEGLGRDLVPTQPEFGDELLGEQPFPRGQDLAELDVGGAEVLEGASQTS